MNDNNIFIIYDELEKLLIVVERFIRLTRAGTHIYTKLNDRIIECTIYTRSSCGRDLRNNFSENTRQRHVLVFVVHVLVYSFVRGTNGKYESKRFATTVLPT